MATLQNIDATTERYYVPSVIDNSLLTNILMVKLWHDRRVASGGSEIVQPVALTTPASVGSYAGADILDLVYDRNIYGAEFPWCNYFAGISITGEDDYKNMGPQAVINLLETQCQLADAALRQRIGGDLQLDGTGNSGKNILGLTAAIATSGTYGNISRSTFTNWKSNVSTSGSNRSVTLDIFNVNAWSATRDNDRPNLYVTTSTVLAKLTTLLQANQRFTTDGYLADIGFQNITYQGRPVVMDQNVATSPGSIVWGLNTKYLTLYVQEARAFRYVPFQTAYNQDAATAKILVSLQLVCNQPRAQLSIQNLDPTL